MDYRRLIDGVAPGMYAVALLITTLLSVHAVEVVAVVGGVLLVSWYAVVRRLMPDRRLWR